MGTLRLVAAVLAAVATLSSCEEGIAYSVLRAEGAAASSATDIAELQKGIEEYRAEADRTVKATERMGSYWRLLGAAYMGKGMYREAMEAYVEAAGFFPASAGIFYNIGVAAGYVAKAAWATDDDPGRESALSRAERSLLRARELDPVSGRTLYALAVLYSFELGNPEAAIEAARALLEIEKSNPDAMMVLGRALYQAGRYAEAAAAFEAVAGTNAGEETKKAAERNRASALAESDGSD